MIIRHVIQDSRLLFRVTVHHAAFLAILIGNHGVVIGYLESKLSLSPPSIDVDMKEKTLVILQIQLITVKKGQTGIKLYKSRILRFVFFSSLSSSSSLLYLTKTNPLPATPTEERLNERAGGFPLSLS